MRKEKFNSSSLRGTIVLRSNPSDKIASSPTAPRNDTTLSNLKFDKQGLIPAIIQDYKTKEVLMLAYMNKGSLARTIKSGSTCFWSRSRKKYWTKGETSGCFQFIKEIAYDCDMDTLLIKVRQVGVACHTGNRSCFYRQIIK